MKKKFQRFHDVQKLKDEIKEETPKTDILKQENTTVSSDKLRKILKLNFKDIPISYKTFRQLQQNNFHKLTEIQRCVIPHALAGRDILAASKTGSGKTLSFVIPVIENLYRKKWTVLDGLGAIVILPTRELAIQVFEVFKSLLEKGHDLTLGLLIGGKNIEIEKNVVNRMNILVCTPGRLLQHINESFTLSFDNMQIMVLDEADEILSKGFQDTLAAIFEIVPINQTQNMLFSATLSKNIQKLTRLTLKKQENILLHQKNQQVNDQTSASNIYEIPDFLKQYYIMVPHQEKLDQLFSFLKSHRNSKCLVFVSTVKQVRFIYETFIKLRIGLPLYEYHGRQPQSKRMAVVYNFKEKKNGVLITTNISSRGLDIPMVKWVIQMDCPDSLETYIHRIGRTARFSKKGKSILFLDPSEQKFIDNLFEKKYQVDKIQVNPQKQLTIQQSLQAYCAEIEDIKYLAQRYFISFLKSIYKQKDKEVFNIKKINYKQLAKSLGLIQVPSITIGNQKTNEPQTDKPEQQTEQKLTRNQKKLQRLKNKFKNLKDQKSINDQDLQKNLGDKLATTRENQNIKRSKKIIDIEEDDDDFLKPKKSSLAVDKLKINPLKISKRQMGKIKPGGVFNQENMFDIDDSGNLISARENQQQIYKQNLEKNKKYDHNMLQKRKMELQENDEKDREQERQRVLNKRSLRKKYNQFQIMENFFNINPILLPQPAYFNNYQFQELQKQRKHNVNQMRKKIKMHKKKQKKKYKIGFRNQFPSLFEVYGLKKNRAKKKKKVSNKLIKRFDIELINIGEKIKEVMEQKNLHKKIHPTNNPILRQNKIKKRKRVTKIKKAMVLLEKLQKDQSEQIPNILETSQKPQNKLKIKIRKLFNNSQAIRNNYDDQIELREYIDNTFEQDLDFLILGFINKLNFSQLFKKQIQPLKYKKRLVFGFNEVIKSLQYEKKQKFFNKFTLIDNNCCQYNKESYGRCY